MKTDLKAMTIADLDLLLHTLTEERASRKEKHPDTPPANARAAINPAWRCDAFGNGGLVIQICHPGHGWVGFIFERVSASMLCGATIANLLSTPAPKDNNAGATVIPVPTGPKH